MTPKDLEDIRSWRRGEWAADITEIESMVYGLVDELDRLRAAVSTIHLGLTLGLAIKREPSPNPGAVEAIEFVLKTGRELGLWK